MRACLLAGFSLAPSDVAGRARAISPKSDDSLSKSLSVKLVSHTQPYIRTVQPKPGSMKGGRRPGSQNRRKPLTTGLKLSLGAAVFVLLYGRYRACQFSKDPSKLHDPLIEFNLFRKDHPLHVIGDGWSLSHLFLHGVLGAVDPHSEAEILKASTAWEAMEYFFDVFQPYLVKNPTKWWYSKVTDLAMNKAGFKSGATIASLFQMANGVKSEA